MDADAETAPGISPAMSRSLPKTSKFSGPRSQSQRSALGARRLTTLRTSRRSRASTASTNAQEDARQPRPSRSTFRTGRRTQSR
jgi:hypothetical protein